MADMLTELGRKVPARPAREVLTVEQVGASSQLWWNWDNAVMLARMDSERDGTRYRVQRVDVEPHPDHPQRWKRRAWRITKVVAEPCS